MDTKELEEKKRDDQSIHQDNTENPIVSIMKLFTGRVLLTIICGTVFIMLSYTMCNILTMKAAEITLESMNGILNMVLLIISNVITFYFSKDKSDEKSKRNQEDEWQVSIKKTK